MRYFVTVNGALHEIEVSGGDRRYSLTELGQPSPPVDAEVHGCDGAYRVRLGHRVVNVLLEGVGSTLRVEVGGRVVEVGLESEQAAGNAGAGKKLGTGAARAVTAQMPGRILQVRVAPGERVAPGSPLLVIEAMKMENELHADVEAVVERVVVEPGDAVEAGAPLLFLK